jgi:hypothetical protein
MTQVFFLQKNQHVYQKKPVFMLIQNSLKWSREYF